MQLHGIEARLLGPQGRAGIVTKDPVDIFLPHGASLVIAETGHRGREERQTGHGPGGLPAGMAQLHGDAGPRRVDGFHQAPEAGQQAIVIDTELMREALAVGTDVGGFRDQETGTAFGPFLVVGHQPVGHFAPGVGQKLVAGAMSYMSCSFLGCMAGHAPDVR